jgi:hypothetical protein
MPSSASVNAGADSVSYAQDRPAYWRAEAARVLAEYNNLLTVRKSADERMSGPIPVVAVW